MAQAKPDDTYSYKGWLISDHFYKRSLAIFGHYLVAAFAIYFIILFIILIFAFIFGGLGLLFR